MRATVLPPNQPRHFYRGGVNIARFRGVDPIDAYRPEDWIGSATTRLGAESVGLTTPPDGRTLRSALDENPVGWLGSAHTQRWGATPALLVKLLEQGSGCLCTVIRVGCSPVSTCQATSARRRHGSSSTRLAVTPASTSASGTTCPNGTCGPGTATQDRDALLGAANRIEAHAGESVVVPAGLPHAIDPGVFLVELLEPTDFSVLLEWEGFAPDPGSAHLSLGWDVALQCVDRRAMSPEAVARLVHSRERMAEVRPQVLRVFADAADPYFRAELISGGGVTDPSFAILVVLDGEGSIDFSDGAHLPVRRGQTVLVPHGAGAAVIVGDIEVFRCLPPNPATPPEA